MHTLDLEISLLIGCFKIKSCLTENKQKSKKFNTSLMLLRCFAN